MLTPEESDALDREWDANRRHFGSSRKRGSSAERMRRQSAQGHIEMILPPKAIGQRLLALPD